jgi:hypothetical protein
VDLDVAGSNPVAHPKILQGLTKSSSVDTRSQIWISFLAQRRNSCRSPKLLRRKMKAGCRRGRLALHLDALVEGLPVVGSRNSIRSYRLFLLRPFSSALRRAGVLGQSIGLPHLIAIPIEMGANRRVRSPEARGRETRLQIQQQIQAFSREGASRAPFLSQGAPRQPVAEAARREIRDFDGPGMWRRWPCGGPGF